MDPLPLLPVDSDIQCISIQEYFFFFILKPVVYKMIADVFIYAVLFYMVPVDNF
jgi:hypothetical protein